MNFLGFFGGGGESSFGLFFWGEGGEKRQGKQSAWTYRVVHSPGTPLRFLIIGSRTEPSHLFGRGVASIEGITKHGDRDHQLLAHANVAIVINEVEIRNSADVLRLGAMQGVVTSWVELMGVQHAVVPPVEGDELAPDGRVPVQRVHRHVEPHALLLLLPLPLRPDLEHIHGWQVDRQRGRRSRSKRSSSFNRLRDNQCGLAVHRRPETPSGKAAQGNDCRPLEDGGPQGQSGGEECVHFAQ